MSIVAPFSAIHCIGLSHRTAAAALRERAAFPPDSLAAALGNARRTPGIERLVIVSTCHRTELYAELPNVFESDCAAATEREARLIDWLASMRSLDRNLVASHTYSHHTMYAVRHLFRLTAGLDSVVLGEPQILSQAAAALRESVAAHAASPALKKLFKAAVRAGERARASVWGRLRAADLGTAAIGAASACLANHGQTLAESRVAVVGAGEIAELVMAALGAAGSRNATVLSRTADRAVAVAARHGGAARRLEELEPVLADVDAAIFAIAATGAVVDAESVRRVLDARAGRPLVLIDVSLPRNVDPAVRTVPGARLVDIDELGPHVARLHADRALMVPAVERIVGEELSLLQRSAPAGKPASWPQLAGT
ncbi:MAG: glutamyl-tRNA reductase [Gemmatimonadaceae bacterium]|nr:glutamyl-tRNA reductase [Gemmatimonadaceae bacterium]